ncbi:MAG TPA: NADH-quinone oxidoreductase subunit N [Verrucomicrobiae bacterium]|nr:NADH-quinone oxidoreductase subunit N [Verrucomicrobiae bacterium]
MSYFELLKLALPETIVAAAALAVLLGDFWMRDLAPRSRRLLGAMIAAVGCGVAMAWMLISTGQTNVLEGIFIADPLTRIVKIGILILTVFTILLSIDTGFTPHIGEYFALILLATVGMMFLVSSEDILMIFVALELTSLSLYILTAFNKRNIKSAEAALKYFLFGGMAAAFTLFGLSLVYGFSGSTTLSVIASGLAGKGGDPLLVVAIVMVVVGFAFKVAAVPFHLWAPDAYEGAPVPSAAFIASGSKVASFFVLAKIMMVGFETVEGSGAWRQFVTGWAPLIAILAALSMILGNLAAIAQTSVRRLIAYSAIAHAGYALLGVVSDPGAGVPALIYYVLTYGLTTVGAFGVVAVVEQGTGADRLVNFAGLSRRSPVASFCMFIFMLSLAGIPPLAGFFGKFYVFAAVLQSDPNLGLLWLVVLAIAMSAVSLYYYLQVLKQIYVAEPGADAVAFPVSPLRQTVLILLALGVVILGCAPSLLLQPLANAVEAIAGH